MYHSISPTAGKVTKRDRFLSIQFVVNFRYRDFRESTGPSYTHTLTYWNVLAARLAFIIVFEHLIFLIIYLMQWLVPSVPKKIKDKIDHERYIDQSERWANERAAIDAVNSTIAPMALNKIARRPANDKKSMKTVTKTTEIAPNRRRTILVAPIHSKKD